MAALTKEQKLQSQLEKVTKDTATALYEAGIQKKEVAEVAGVDSSAITHQFKKGRITMSVYLAAQMLLESR